MAIGTITTLEDLREHLQWAIELEHFTLPPYLYALYSIDGARNPAAEEIVRSVVLEEMLHMTLAANLLNAVGGRPRLDSPRMLVGYPACMPHGDRSFEVPVLPLCPEALEIFMKVEQPSSLGAPPQGDYYQTIGQFYRAIEAGVRELCARFGEAHIFSGDRARQVTGPLFGPGRGQLHAIDSLQAALAALEEIVEQGEGAAHGDVWDGDRDFYHPERDQVAHYYRFQELKLGRRYRRGDTPRSGPTGERIAIDWAGVHGTRPTPQRSRDGSDARRQIVQSALNQTYCALLQQLDQTFDGSPQLLMPAIGTMYRLKELAQELMLLRGPEPTELGATIFEYVPPEHRADRADR